MDSVAFVQSSIFLTIREGMWLGIKEEPRGSYRWMDGTYPEWSTWLPSEANFDEPHVQVADVNGTMKWMSSSNYSSGLITCVTDDCMY